MWIFTRKSFVSVVAHDTEENLLHVRARFRGDIEELFPEADVAETPKRDYRFRTSLPRERVIDLIAIQIRQIDYTTFKDNVHDPERRDAYIQVWTEMWKAQHQASKAE
jgi:hypothetical protein